MGGSAFSSGEDALLTPRMPPPVYRAVRAHCHAVLARLFHTVASPLDGPDKADYGDVDMVVARPKMMMEEEGGGGGGDDGGGLDGVVAAFGGVRRAMVHRRCLNLALPWPASFSHHHHQSEGERERFVQVDVCLCASDDDLRWMLFRHAHGDLGSILGSIIHPYGLTMTEDGLYLRIGEMERSNRRRARVLVSKDPDVTLDLLSLPIARFWSGPFDEADDMYEFAAQCPMFSLSAQDDDDDDDDDDDGDKAPRNNAAYRRRIRRRPVFRRWVDDFQPRCRRHGRFLQPRTSRERVTADILTRFPDTRAEFHSRRTAFLRQRQEASIRQHLIVVVAAEQQQQQQSMLSPRLMPTYRACLIKALASVVFHADETFPVTLPEEGFVGPDGLYVMDRVLAFLQHQSAAVGSAAWERHHRGR
ncbi:hypothetical protein XA68_11162 [Ophiocordyceps unilateralis]|uniref:Uncharacterized protein n=1 Tax=Ophiocordyceps unilateralis TaxID=268505 RepID=A0A2A9P293_OPHUN|nr:hypothetical protein XA68_11162 [Ophiocordyceps unilateralis]